MIGDNGLTRLRAARVFTATGTVLKDGFVSVRDGRIVAVGHADRVTDDPTSTPTVNYGDATILPGLIDAHVHLTLSGDRRTYEEMATDSDEMMALVALHNLQRHLHSGVTTVRDNGGRNRVVFSVRDAVRRGYFESPRLLLSGRPITHSMGHFHWCNGVADGIEEIRKAVLILVGEGADHIKIMASGGATAGNLPYYSGYGVAELAAAVQTAHQLGRLTTAHCRSKDSMINAIDAGLDCIEHGEFLLPPAEHSRAGSPGRMVYDPAVTARVLERGMFISYTLQAGGYPSYKALQDRRDAGAQLSGAELAELASLEDYFAQKRTILSRLLEDGMEARLVISSDAGPWDNSFGRLDLGLRAAVESGAMGPATVLTSVTRIAAQACGISHLVGTLETGKEADVLVVDGDPLTDIAAIANVRAVYRAGRLIGPSMAVPVSELGTW